MLRDYKKLAPYWRLVTLLPVMIAAFLSTIGTGGSGDDGTTRFPFQANWGAGDVITLNEYTYTIADRTAGNLLTLTTGDGQSTFQIQVTLGNSLTGSFNTISEDYTLDSASRITVNTDLGDPLLGEFAVDVVVAIFLETHSDPVAGQWQVLFPATNPTETTTVTFYRTAVGLSLNGDPEVKFFKENFAALFNDNSAPEWQRRAAWSTRIVEFFIEQADEVTKTLEFISGSLQLRNPLSVICMTLPGTPPAGVLNPGSFDFTWLGSGQITSGDNFNWSFSDCWFNDFDDDDELVTGNIDLVNYNKVVDANNRLIRVGYETVGPVPGGLSYNNLTIAEIQENPPTIFIIDPWYTVTVTGGFSIVFAEPTP